MDAGNITIVRRKGGIGQGELAKALGLPPQRLSDMERGHADPPDGFDDEVVDAVEQILRSRLFEVARYLDDYSYAT